jgi:hypothetical protein
MAEEEESEIEDNLEQDSLEVRWFNWSTTTPGSLNASRARKPKQIVCKQVKSCESEEQTVNENTLTSDNQGVAEGTTWS